MSKQSFTSSNKDAVHIWENILIDTSVITRVFNYVKNQKKENKFCFELVNSLASTKCQKTVNSNSNKQIDRNFFVSAISIAELSGNLQNSSNKTKKIIEALETNNVTILPFDEDVADIFTDSFCDKLLGEYQGDYLVRWGERNTKSGREVLTRDMMILATGLSVNVDTVLTHDKGMYRIAKECNLHCAYTDERFFKKNDKYIFEYESNLSNKELLNEKQQRQPQA